MNSTLLEKITNSPARSAWGRGVKIYALNLIEDAEIELTKDNLKIELLNGADNWSAYSYGGCALIYDQDIAERLCSPSEFKKNRTHPNARETWLDCQTRALVQAFNLIKSNL